MGNAVSFAVGAASGLPSTAQAGKLYFDKTNKSLMLDIDNDIAHRLTFSKMGGYAAGQFMFANKVGTLTSTDAVAATINTNGEVTELNFNKNATFAGDVSIADELNVSGATSFHDVVEFGQGIRATDAEGTLYLQITDDAIKADKRLTLNGALLATGDAIFTNGINVTGAIILPDESINNNMLVGNIPNTKIANLDAAKLTGTLNIERIADGSINDVKINTISASKVTTGIMNGNLGLTGTLTTDGGVKLSKRVVNDIDYYRISAESATGIILQTFQSDVSYGLQLYGSTIYPWYNGEGRVSGAAEKTSASEMINLGTRYTRFNNIETKTLYADSIQTHSADALCLDSDNVYAGQFTTANPEYHFEIGRSGNYIKLQTYKNEDGVYNLYGILLNSDTVYPYYNNSFASNASGKVNLGTSFNRFKDIFTTRLMVGLNSISGDAFRVGGHSYFDSSLAVGSGNTIIGNAKNRVTIQHSSDYDNDLYVSGPVRFIDCLMVGGNTSTASARLRITSKGTTNNTYAYSMYAEGVCLAVNFSQNSDRRLKRDFALLADDEQADSFFDKLKPTSYCFINDDSDKRYFGFIAQEVEENMNRSFDNVSLGAVTEPVTEEDFYGLCYSDFTALNTSQIQKLKARVLELEKQLNDLTVRMLIQESKE